MEVYIFHDVVKRRIRGSRYRGNKKKKKERENMDAISSYTHGKRLQLRVIDEVQPSILHEFERHRVFR